MFTVSTLSELNEVAKNWVSINSEPVTCLLNAEMGAGKTTLIKQICTELGVSENISSPTFSLVNEYKTKDGKSIFHFDLYRINSPEELYDIGFEEYLDRKSYVFIEWPEVASSFFNSEEKEIKISVENEIRSIEFC